MEIGTALVPVPFGVAMEVIMEPNRSFTGANPGSARSPAGQQRQENSQDDLMEDVTDSARSAYEQGERYIREGWNSIPTWTRMCVVLFRSTRLSQWCLPGQLDT